MRAPSLKFFEKVSREDVEREVHFRSYVAVGLVLAKQRFCIERWCWKGSRWLPVVLCEVAWIFELEWL